MKRRDSEGQGINCEEGRTLSKYMLLFNKFCIGSRTAFTGVGGGGLGWGRLLCQESVNGHDLET